MLTSNLCSSLVFCEELLSLSAVLFSLIRRECLSLLIKHIPCFSLFRHKFPDSNSKCNFYSSHTSACCRILLSHSKSCSKNFCKLLTGKMGTSALTALDFWIGLVFFCGWLVGVCFSFFFLCDILTLGDLEKNRLRQDCMDQSHFFALCYQSR